MSVTPEGAPLRPAYLRDAAGLYYKIGGIAVPAPHTHPSNTASRWNYVDTTAMSNPSTGNIRGNTASGTPTTQIAVHTVSATGTDMTDVLLSLVADDIVLVQEESDKANWVRFKISGAPVNNGTWFQIPVEQTDVGGTELARNDDVLITFTYGTHGGGGGGLDQSTADGLYVNLTGDTMSGELALTAAAGVHRGLTFKTDAEARWIFGKNSAAEAGANAGSDFMIARYDDDGVFISDSFSIGRADNQAWFWGPPPALFNRTPVAPAHVTSKEYVDAADATKAPLSHTHVIGDLPTGTTGTTVALGNHTHTGVYDPAGTASSAVSTHASTAGHELMATANPTALTPDIAASPGSGTTVSKVDHVHNVPAAAPTTALTPATTNAEGSGTSFARNDHTHAVTPGAPTTNLTASTTNAEGTAASFARSDHSHAITANVAPSALASSAVVGTSAALARADHQHIFPTAANVGAEPAGAVATHAATAGHEVLASTTPAALTPDITGAVGVGTTVARADHVHNVPAAAPTTNLTATTTNAEGSGASFARNDHTHAIDTAAPVALGAANAVGTATSLARSDHVHIYPTAAQIGAAATSHSHLIADLPVAPSGTSNTTQVVRADDSRLSNARTPTAHNHAASEVNSGVLDVARLGTTPAATEYLKSGGATGSADWVPPATLKTDLALTKTDVGLANVPNTDATARASHTGTQTKSTISDFAHTHVATTDLTATGTKDTTTFLRGDNTWAAPPAGGGVTQSYVDTQDALLLPKAGGTMTGDLSFAASAMITAATTLSLGAGAFAAMSFNDTGYVIMGLDTAGIYVAGQMSTGKQPTQDDHVATKAYVDARTPKVTVATTAPSSPAVNDIWIDSSP